MVASAIFPGGCSGWADATFDGSNGGNVYHRIRPAYTNENILSIGRFTHWRQLHISIKLSTWKLYPSIPH